jgi:MATE family multidrug resistance protein
MSSTVPLSEEPRWEGVREVMAMSGPIILSTLSYSLMGFVDRVMVGRVSQAALAAVTSADIASYTLSTLFMGIVSIVGTFAAQCYGRGEHRDCSRYCWQGLWLSLTGVIFALVLYPLSGPLFHSMGHSAEVTGLELTFFRVRLIGYLFVGAMAAFTGFFQAVNRSSIPMVTAIIGNAVNFILNYVLIFGHFGFPAMGIAGSATATVLAMAFQCALLFGAFLSPQFHRQYATRSTWAFDARRFRELVYVGVPAAMSMFLDVANWWIWISWIIGRFGEMQMAANTVALSFNQFCFMPVIGLHMGISAIVGQWIGRGDPDRAHARTRTTLKMAAIYMVCMGLVFAVFGGWLARAIFNPDNPAIVPLAARLLFLAAMFQAFDAANITYMGALRGAGDTRWMMWTTLLIAYGFGLPLSCLLGFVIGLETYGAWIGATVYIIVLSGMLMRRFEGGRWRRISIFSETRPAG